MTGLTTAQLAAIFAKKKEISLRSKGTLRFKSKMAKGFEDFDIEKIEGSPSKTSSSDSNDLFVVREKDSSRGVLITRSQLKETMRKIRENKRQLPKGGQEINKLTESDFGGHV